MSNLNNPVAGLELAQICWVVPDIHAAVLVGVDEGRFAGAVAVSSPGL